MANSGVIYEGGCVVSTFAGTGTGYRDGAKDQAEFCFPTDVAVDKDGDIYIVDRFNYILRKIAMADGTVQTVAGTGKEGYKDGPAREAQFLRPHGIVVGDNGDVFILDCPSRVFSPTSKTVRSIAVHEAVSSSSAGVSVTADGNVLVNDFDNHRVVKIRAGGGSIEIVEGNRKSGYNDGEAHELQSLRHPPGIAVSSNGDIYVADRVNNYLRKIDARTGVVSTVAGTGAKGWRDGNASEAQFNDARGLAIGPDGCVYICEAGNFCIRKYDPAHGRVTTVAGTGEEDDCDGGGDEAGFFYPQGLTFGHDGVLYVADEISGCIRAITLPKKTEAELSESDFQDIEKKLEQKTQLMSELAQETHEASACTLTARKDLEKTKDATIEATKALAKTQNVLKVKRLELWALWEQRKAELQAVESEVAKMKSTKDQRVAELVSAQAELGEAQAVLDKVIFESTQYAEELERTEAHLERARAKHAMERSTSLVAGMTAGGFEDAKSEKSLDTTETETDESQDVAGNITNVAGGVAAPAKNRAPTGGPLDETAISTERTRRHGGKGKGFRRPMPTCEAVGQVGFEFDREEQRGFAGGFRQDEGQDTVETARAGTNDEGGDSAQETGRLRGA